MLDYFQSLFNENPLMFTLAAFAIVFFGAVAWSCITKPKLQ